MIFFETDRKRIEVISKLGLLNIVLDELLAMCEPANYLPVLIDLLQTGRLISKHDNNYPINQNISVALLIDLVKVEMLEKQVKNDEYTDHRDRPTKQNLKLSVMLQTNPCPGNQERKNRHHEAQ